MGRREDETPTDPETAAHWRELAKRARRRSTQVLKHATTTAMQISAIDGIDVEVRALELLTQKLRTAFDDAIDLAHGTLSTELVQVAAERKALAERLEEAHAEGQRLRDRITAFERAQSIDQRRLQALENDVASYKAQLRSMLKGRSEGR